MLFLGGRRNAGRARPCPGAYVLCSVIPATGEGQGHMWVRLLAAALMAVALVSSAEAQTPGPETAPATHAPARRQVHKHHVERSEARRSADQTNANATPSWLTLGQDGSTGSASNYATGAFNQPSAVEGTMSGYRGRNRVDSQYGAPGAPLLNF